MTKRKSIKFIALLLSALLVASILPAAGITAHADDPAAVITLNVSEIELTDPNDTIALYATLETDEYQPEDICWETDDNEIAYVDYRGFVKATGIGTTTIYATILNHTNIKATCKVTVTGIKYPKQWESGDTIVTLTEDGTVTVAKKEGSGNGAMDDYNTVDDVEYGDEEPNYPPWEGYSVLFKNLIVEEGVTKIGRFTFQDSHLDSATLPGTVTTINKAAFCSSWLPRIDIPEGVETIGEAAFSNSDIKSVSLPSSLKVIGDSAFYYCEYLENIDIPEGVTEIGEMMFDGCKS